jgi:multiple antibiotic resistance protein
LGCCRSIVSLGCPLIAGPSTIAATVAMSAEAGSVITFLAMSVAVVINILLMVASPLISGALRRFDLMGALIRFTGLIVATLGAQMVLNGLAEWKEVLQSEADSNA